MNNGKVAKMQKFDEGNFMKRSLTGIQTTGVPHLGNYLGAIKPALEHAKEYESYYFMADYHSLNSIKDAEQRLESMYQIAATWLACGLEPQNIHFYRQSDVPQIFELATILAAFMPKGLLNRAHSYKDKVAKNLQAGRTADEDINVGLFTYPVLMAADILMFNPNIVPVGKDQKQHVEMCAEVARVINHTYGKELLVIPKAKFSKEMQVLGLDGRKMSKSYGNTIPLFLPSKKLRKMVMKIKTNSQTVEEPKDPESCSVFALYKHFASPAEQAKLALRYRSGGMGWGDAKQTLYEAIEKELAGKRAVYEQIIADKPYLEKVLKDGAEKVKPIAQKNLDNLRKAMGFVGR